MRVIIQSHQAHTMLEMENLGFIPSVGDTIRFPYKDQIAIGVVEKRSLDLVQFVPTVTLTGHWLKEVK